ncbi:aminoglycoside adenylyltransferase domain-containing protein [Occultella gossypii]|uniref:DUF4111 domain-containing protein n=1 Tax=Occultella gossypii TaxID=2800820 RepID=A0ABS7SAE7_9MICO|nr:DUF4111 domain-containing protein [Occultella gossypii]
MLNACRAVAYADHGALLSKIDGGRWWLERFGPAPLVTSALAAQAAGVALGSCSPSARAFVEAAIARLGPRRSLSASAPGPHSKATPVSCSETVQIRDAFSLLRSGTQSVCGPGGPPTFPGHCGP